MLMVKEKIKRNNLKNIPFIHADGSDRFKPVEHHELANTIVNQTKDMGLSIKKEQWGVSPDHTSLFGEIVLDKVLDNPTMEFTIGIRQNNNMRFPITLVSGTNVFVCSNLMISGEIVLKKRHTIGLHLQDEVRSGLTRCIGNSKDITDTMEMMQNNEINNSRANDLMMESAHQGLFSYSHLKEVQKEWITPSYDDFKPRTEWSLYNSFTEVAKKYNPIRQQTAVGGLVELFSNN
ncbi:DUF932 domain-containing protein [Nitrospinaceae bacterium]|nr:DUF932 domain-containing protein [Nitrospinaceae bacterium]